MKKQISVHTKEAWFKYIGLSENHLSVSLLGQAPWFLVIKIWSPTYCLIISMENVARRRIIEMHQNICVSDKEKCPQKSKMFGFCTFAAHRTPSGENDDSNEL